MVSFFAGIQILRFWPKTMDHSKVFDFIFFALITPHWRVI